jgi:hypothetical protein
MYSLLHLWLHYLIFDTLYRFVIPKNRTYIAMWGVKSILGSSTHKFSTEFPIETHEAGLVASALRSRVVRVTI